MTSLAASSNIRRVLSEAPDLNSPGRFTAFKIPILGDIPIIGKYLFTHTHTEQTQDEVMIFVTVDMGNPPNLKADAGIPRTSQLIHAYQKKIDLLEAEAQKRKDKDAANADSPDERTVDEILADIKKDNNNR